MGLSLFFNKCGYVGPLAAHKKPPVYVETCLGRAEPILPKRIEWADEKPRWRCCQCGKEVDPGPNWTGGSLYCSNSCAYA